MISMILWEFLFSLFDAILLAMFADLFLQEKRSSLCYKLTAIFLMALCIFIVSYIPVFSYASSLYIVLLSTVYCIVLYKGEILYRIAISILFQIMYMIYSLGLVALTSMLLGDNATAIYEYDSLIRIVFIIFTRLFFALIIYVITNKKAHKKIRLLLSKKALILLFIGCIAFLIITNLIYDHTLTSREKDIYLLILALVVFSLIIAMIMKMLFDEKAKREELQMQKKVLEMQQEDYHNRAMQEQDIRKMKHDLKNNLYSLESLVREKKYEEVETYINKLSGMPALKKIIDSGNPVIDGLLNVNIQTYPDIQFHAAIEIDQCEMDADVLSTILGNALNNAIEATSEITDTKNAIFITIRENRSCIVIEVENKYERAPTFEQGNIVTNKADNINHGFGIYNIEQAARLYQGRVTYDIDKKAKTFKLTVLLMKK